jgi:hypothetical protein
MNGDGVAIARGFLDRFEAAIASRDLGSVRGLCAKGVVLFGTARANFGPEETSAYLRLVAEQHKLRWLLNQWSVLHHDSQHLLVAAAGQVEGDDGTEIDTVDFRLSMWLVQERGEWRMKHFHGSVPEPLG